MWNRFRKPSVTWAVEVQSVWQQVCSIRSLFAGLSLTLPT